MSLKGIVQGSGGGGGTPGGSDTQVQFNDSGSFGGDAGLTYNKTTDVLTVTGRVDTPVLRAQSSAGILLESNSGTDIALMGAGGGAGVTFYDGVIYNANTADTLAYHNGSKALNSATVSNTATITTSLSAGTLSSNFTGTVRDKFNFEGSETIVINTDMDLVPSDNVLLRLSPESDGFLIWGIRNFDDGRFLVLENIGDTHTIIIEHDSPSTSEYRIYCPNNQDYVLQANSAAIAICDVDSTVYRIIAVSQSGVITWGSITGTLADQTDLNSALSAKADSSFKTISVSGQSDVVADSATDTLTLVAGSNITITTNAGTDTITIAASGGGSGLTQGQVFARVMNIGVI